MIKSKRVYDAVSPEDGCRVLIDRLWPRGLSRSGAGVDVWLRRAAPAGGFRRDVARDPDRWEEFRRRYRKQLERKADPLRQIRRLERERKVVTLLFAARDEERCGAAVLRESLAETAAG